MPVPGEGGGEAGAGHRWVAQVRAARAGQPRILSFPHAGGSVLSAGPLIRHLPARLGLAVANLPGREDGEPLAPPRRAAAAAAAIARALAAEGESDARPAVFLGNSYGALLAYETARAVVALGRPEPRLIVSGFRSPLLPPADEPLFAAPRALLRAELSARFGLSRNDFDRMGLDRVEGALRADLEACETYRHAAGVRLTLPVEVIEATGDPAVSRDELLAWGDVSDGGLRVRAISGGHFCWATHPAEVADAVVRIVGEMALAGAGARTGL